MHSSILQSIPHEHAHQLIHILCLPVTYAPGWHAGAASHAAAAPVIVIVRPAGGHAGGAPEPCIKGQPAALRGQPLPAHADSRALLITMLCCLSTYMLCCPSAHMHC